MRNYPFMQEELSIRGRYDSLRPGVAGKPMFSTPISASENMARFVSGQQPPVWMPYNETRLIEPEIIADNVARAMVFEANATDRKGGPDMFGVNWIYDPVARGSMVRPGAPCLKDVNDWKNVICFPDVDSWDWEGSAKRNSEYTNCDWPIQTTQFTGFFERLISFMDFENAAISLIDEEKQDAVKELFSALADLYIKILDKCIEHYHVSWYVLHDDWGSQHAPLFSRNAWLEMIAPYVKRIVDHCHKKGVIFEMHSCGHTESMLDLISSIGIDMWRPQTMNDLDQMYQDFGDKICLGMNVSFPDDTSEEDQRQLAKGIVKRFNQPGKYVYIGLVPNMRCPNTDAFYATLYEESRKLYLQF